jgi:hypothetical protein
MRLSTLGIAVPRRRRRTLTISNDIRSFPNFQGTGEGLVLADQPSTNEVNEVQDRYLQPSDIRVFTDSTARSLCLTNRQKKQSVERL